MPNKSITEADPAQIMHVASPSLNGGELRRSIELREQLTAEALENARHEVFFPSRLTKEVVREAQRDMVRSRLRAHVVNQQYVDEAFQIIVRSGLEQVVRNLAVDGVEFTSGRIAAKLTALEGNLRASWRRFMQQAIANRQWADELPPSFRERAFKSIDESVDSFYRVMDTLLREFEALCREKVGRE